MSLTICLLLNLRHVYSSWPFIEDWMKSRKTSFQSTLGANISVTLLGIVPPSLPAKICPCRIPSSIIRPCASADSALSPPCAFSVSCSSRVSPLPICDWNCSGSSCFIFCKSLSMSLTDQSWYFDSYSPPSGSFTNDSSSVDTIISLTT